MFQKFPDDNVLLANWKKSIYMHKKMRKMKKIKNRMKEMNIHKGKMRRRERKIKKRRKRNPCKVRMNMGIF